MHSAIPRTTFERMMNLLMKLALAALVETTGVFSEKKKDKRKGVRVVALVSFLARSKPKVPFLSISLLRNQTETLATQAIAKLMQGLLFSLRAILLILTIYVSLIFN